MKREAQRDSAIEIRTRFAAIVLAAIVGATLLVFPVSVAASPLLLRDDFRIIRAIEDEAGDLCPDVTPGAPFAAFDASGGCISGFATQSSTATPMVLSGSGTLDTGGGGHSIDVESLYALRFTVAELTAFVLTADFSFSSLDDPSGPPGANAETQALARLSFVSTQLLEFHEAFPDIIGPPTAQLVFEHDLPLTNVGGNLVLVGSGVVSEFGVLNPGNTYLIEVGERAYREQFVDSDNTGWNFSFVVPEPSSSVLLGTGLVLLTAVRRSIGSRTRRSPGPVRNQT